MPRISIRCCLYGFALTSIVVHASLFFWFVYPSEFVPKLGSYKTIAARLQQLYDVEDITAAQPVTKQKGVTSIATQLNEPLYVTTRDQNSAHRTVPEEKFLKKKRTKQIRREQNISLTMEKIVCGNELDITKVDSLITQKRRQVDLFIAVITAPQHQIRRVAIRHTWLLKVKRDPRVALQFFTDGKNLPSEIEEMLWREQDLFNDLVLLPTTRGYLFSHRILHAMFWAYKRFDFKFFLRMDDDYFVCIENLLRDIQHRQHEKFLYWGYMHCIQPGQVRIDEGFLILQVDLVREIIKRNQSLCCHPFGDQAVAMWVNRLDLEGVKVTYFADNQRVVHRRRKNMKEVKSSFCESLIAVHEIYPRQMLQYWNVTKGQKLNPSVYNHHGVQEYKNYCKYPKGLHWKAFLMTFWGHEPKPCWSPGVLWPKLSGIKHHKGRQQLRKEISKKLRKRGKVLT